MKIFLPLWVFLLGPALCLGGLVEHPCECPFGIPLQGEDHDHHERACTEDPCTIAVQPEKLGDVLHHPVRCEAVDPVHLSEMEIAAQSAFERRTPGLPPDRPNFACAPSDRPLRI